MKTLLFVSELAAINSLLNQPQYNNIDISKINDFDGYYGVI